MSEVWGRGRSPVGRWTCRSLLAAVFLATWPGVSSAQTPVSVEATDDPDPLPGDFSLPMPCHLKMVFRLVCIPARGELEDETISLGEPAADAAQGFYFNRRQGHISGSLTFEALPPPWQKQINAIDAMADQRGRCPQAPKPNADQKRAPDAPASSTAVEPFYYFMGKYSVSAYQYAAVMGDQCPAQAPTREVDAAPKTGISWFDAVEFAKRYTIWLYREQRAALPVREGADDVFIRLPTETEWEYAARGGQMVNPDDIEQEPAFPLHDKPLTDFAWYSPEDSTPKQGFASIGSLAPNPLGLYDILGNSAQIVLDSFEMSTGHAHGAIGGFMTKGGSFRSREADILPGARTENRYFLSGKPHVLPDAGLRVVIASVVVTADRIGDLRDQWQQFGAIANIVPSYDPKQDPMEQLNKLRDGIDDPHLKTALAGVGSTLKDAFSQVEEQRRDAAKGLIRSAAFAAESCLNYDIRLADVQAADRDVRTKLAAVGKDKLSPKEAATADAVLRRNAQGIETLKKAADETLTYYIGLIMLSEKYPAKLLASQFQSVLDETRNQGVFGPVFSRRVETFRRHIESFQQSHGKIDREQIRKDILG